MQSIKLLLFVLVRLLQPNWDKHPEMFHLSSHGLISRIWLVIKWKEMLTDNVWIWFMFWRGGKILSEKVQPGSTNPVWPKDFTAADAAVSTCPRFGAQQNYQAISSLCLYWERESKIWEKKVLQVLPAALSLLELSNNYYASYGNWFWNLHFYYVSGRRESHFKDNAWIFFYTWTTLDKQTNRLKRLLQLLWMTYCFITENMVESGLIINSLLDNRIQKSWKYKMKLSKIFQ